MKNVVTVMLMIFVLTACGGGYDGPVQAADHPDPQLVRFDVVDSYGVDTSRSALPLALNPDKSDGLFDVSWAANSYDDYRVNIRLNNAPNDYNSLLIYSQSCGAGRACDQSGGVICQYTSDLYMSCNNSSRIADVSSLFKSIPQKLYLVLEVCSVYTSYCAYDYYPVTLE